MKTVLAYASIVLTIFSISSIPTLEKSVTDPTGKILLMGVVVGLPLAITIGVGRWATAYMEQGPGRQVASRPTTLAEWRAFERDARRALEGATNQIWVGLAAVLVGFVLLFTPIAFCSGLLIPASILTLITAALRRSGAQRKIYEAEDAIANASAP